MQENILNAFAEQAKTMYAPMTKFNSLFVENMEKLTEYQIGAVKSLSRCERLLLHKRKWRLTSIKK